MKYFILSIMVFLSACTNTLIKEESLIDNDKNPRIIFKNLIKPNIKDDIVLLNCKPTTIVKTIVKECVNTSDNVIKNQTNTYHLLNNKPLLVGFYNEQTKQHDQNLEFLDFLRSANINSSYIIMGHSHGLSSYGVEKLAYMRANHIKTLLIEHGIPSENIITLANWSRTSIKGTPPLGVEIYY